MTDYIYCGRRQQRVAVDVCRKVCRYYRKCRAGGMDNVVKSKRRKRGDVHD